MGNIAVEMVGAGGGQDRCSDSLGDWGGGGAVSFVWSPVREGVDVLRTSVGRRGDGWSCG